MVTESSKFGRRAFARYATPEQVDILVTDALIEPAARQTLEESRITVMIASKDQSDITD
ncbi:MAG: hypothetical protein M1133_05800 [Armatimonadetes bacterium]|nr:hypothetical protein [Armatimonadota bacterium]